MRTRIVRLLLRIVGAEIVIGGVCLGMSIVRSARAQNVSSQAPAETMSQDLAGYNKPPLSNEADQGRVRVEWKEGKLSVNADSALLSEVLHQVSLETGIEILNLDQLHKKISVHFSNVALHVGLRILVWDMDYGSIGAWSGDPSTIRMVIREPVRESGVPTPPPASSVPIGMDQVEIKNDPQSRFRAGDLDPTTDLSVLGQALGDKDLKVREAAIQALAERGGSEAMDLLRQAFRDSDTALKMTVIENIGSTPEVLPLLREASQDSDASVREAALAVVAE